MLLESIKFILMGAYVTIAVIAVALPLGFIFGLLLAMVRVYGSPLISRLTSI